MAVPVEAVIIIAGWLVSLAVALKAVPALAAKRVSEQFGLTMVEQNGRKFYAPVDPDGKPVKIPIGVKKDADGNDAVEFGYAPLAYAMPYMAAEMAALKVRMAIMGVKSGASKRLRGAIEEGVASGDLPGELLISQLPKKAQAAIAIIRSLGLGIGPTSQSQGNERTSSRGGEK